MGKWEYEKLEHVTGKEEYLQDPAVKEAHESNKGLVFIFGEDKSFVVSKQVPGMSNVLIQQGSFVFSEDKNFLLTKTTGGITGQLQIIELSEKTLKINSTPSSEEYVVLKKAD